MYSFIKYILSYTCIHTHTYKGNYWKCKCSSNIYEENQSKESMFLQRNSQREIMGNGEITCGH